jgi:hypothetical protein
MCKVDGESIDQLFFHCPVASEMWRTIFNLFGMSWVMPRWVVDLWACWQGWLGGSSSSYCDLEGHPTLLDVMPLEGEKCTNL